MFRLLAREFATQRVPLLLELLIITLGLLIALGIDNFTEWRNHQALVEEARQVLRAEIAENAARMKVSLEQIAREQERMQANVDAMAPFQRGRDGPKYGALSLGGTLLGLPLLDTGWRTAQTTGALSYMPYAEARTYNEIYSMQAQLQATRRLIGEDAALNFGIARRFNIASDAQLTAEQAAAFAERYGIWQVHLLELSLYAKHFAELQQAYLENRPVRQITPETMRDGAGQDAAEE
jgi:Mg2+ and Co2+ transporter CorA